MPKSGYFGSGANQLGITQANWASCAASYTCTTALGTCTAVQVGTVLQTDQALAMHSNSCRLLTHCFLLG